MAQRLSSQENLLLDYVQRLEKHKAGRGAVHVHISGLLPHNRREHHVRIAANTFDTLVKKLQGQIFVLSSLDLIFIFKESAKDDVKAAVVKLRFLFSDDPLVSSDVGPKSGNFTTWYNLDKQFDAVLELAQKLVNDEQSRRAVEQQKSTLGGPPRQTVGEPLTPAVLARVEAGLGQADLSNLMRRQAVCAIVGKSPPQPVFNELFISIADLREVMLPNVNLSSSPWLFQQLTETLDRRVLSMLNKHDDRTIAGDISINLNVSTLLSPDFLTFDDNVKAGMRGTIVLELQKIDIFADLGAFLFARDFAHDRGYRICIDGLTHKMLPFVDRERLGVDLIKLVSEPSLAEATSAEASALRARIEAAGPSRVILCRCDNIDAIEWGHTMGITLFQGRHVEGMLAQEMRKRGPVARRPRR